MTDYALHIYSSDDALPGGLMADSFFHSPALFMLSKQTPRHRPYMVVASQPDGTVLAQMLALVRYRSSLLPPYFYMHCRILGAGVYAEGVEEFSAEIFGAMIDALTSRLNRRVLYIEVSNLPQKMFGYRQLRQCGFFPVRWMSVRNDLRPLPPATQLTAKIRKHIADAHRRGVTTEEVCTQSEFLAFSRLLRHHNWLKPKRYVPHDDFFRGIMGSGHGRLFVTLYRHRVIGCSAVVYSQGQAYLWYSAFRRKSLPWLHPADVTIFHALQDAHQRGCEQFYFMDVGLPFSRNPFREFILSFGGKPVSTYRWFRCSIGWINFLFSWFYRD